MSSQLIRISISLLLILIAPRAMGQIYRATIEDFNACRDSYASYCQSLGPLFIPPRTTTFITGPLEVTPFPPSTLQWHLGHFACLVEETDPNRPVNQVSFFGQQVYGRRDCQYYTGTDLDLKIRGITFKQGSANRSGNPANISSAAPLSVTVEVSRVGLSPSFDAEVSIQYEAQLFKKTVTLLTDGSEVRQTVTFEIPLNAADAGEKMITASVSGLPPFEELDAFNNSMQKSVRLIRTCKVEDNGPAAPFFSQVDPNWANDPFGIATLSSAPGSMSKYGCSVSAAAMVFKHYGINRTPIGSPLNPGQTTLPGLGGQPLTAGSLNLAMANYKTRFISRGSVALNSRNNPIWAGVAEVGRASYMTECRQSGQTCDSANAVSFKDPKSLAQTGEPMRQTIESQICNGNPVILKFSKAGGGQHFMLATGTELGANGFPTYRLNNPGALDGEGVAYEGDLSTRYPAILGYVLFLPSRDPSMMFITAPNNVHLVVTDAKGRRSGFDPIQNVHYNEIPNSSYAIQSIDTPNEAGFTPETLVKERYFAASGDVSSGQYRVQVFPVTAGTYYVDVRSYDVDGFTNNSVISEGTLQLGETTEVTFEHTDAPLPTSTPVTFDSQGYLVSQILGASRSTIAVAGRFAVPAGTKLNLQSKFTFRLGGNGGFSLEIPASKFKVSTVRNIKTYSYVNQGTIITLTEAGGLTLAIAKANLTSVPKANIDLIGFTIDNLVVDQKLNAKCLGPLCWSN